MSTKNKELACIEILRHMTRVGSHTQFPETPEAAKSLFDIALVHLWARFHHQGMAWTTFFAIHERMCKAIMDEGELDAVMACDGDYVQVAPQLRRLQDATHIGKALFSHATSLCASQALKDAIDEHLSKVLAQDFRDTAIKSMNMACELLVKATDGGKQTTKRKVQLCVSNIKFECDVPGARQAYEWRQMFAFNLCFKTNEHLMCHHALTN